MKKQFAIFGMLLVAMLINSGTGFSENKRMLLLDAVENKLVQYKVARTKNSFNDNGLQINITNQSKEALVIKIDPALIFEPEDTNYQDLILPGDEVLFVGPGRTNSLEVQTYCGKSYAMSPGSDLAFHFKEKGDERMQKGFGELKQLRASKHLSQQAVWFMTDKKKELSTVYDSDQRLESLKLMAYLAKAYNIQLPEYRTERAIDTTTGNIASLGAILKLHVTLEWKQENPDNLSLSIFNDKNVRIASYFENKRVRTGMGKIDASFETREYPKGDYFIRLYNDVGNVIKEIKVPLE